MSSPNVSRSACSMSSAGNPFAFSSCRAEILFEGKIFVAFEHSSQLAMLLLNCHLHAQLHACWLPLLTGGHGRLRNTAVQIACCCPSHPFTQLPKRAATDPARGRTRRMRLGAQRDWRHLDCANSSAYSRLLCKPCAREARILSHQCRCTLMSHCLAGHGALQSCVGHSGDLQMLTYD